MFNFTIRFWLLFHLYDFCFLNSGRRSAWEDWRESAERWGRDPSRQEQSLPSYGFQCQCSLGSSHPVSFISVLKLSFFLSFFLCIWVFQVGLNLAVSVSVFSIVENSLIDSMKWVFIIIFVLLWWFILIGNVVAWQMHGNGSMKHFSACLCSLFFAGNWTGI